MSFEKVLLSRSEGGTPPRSDFPLLREGYPPAVAIFSQKSKIFACCALLGLKIGSLVLDKCPAQRKILKKVKF